MPRPDTWSDQARPGKLQHHSARGSMPRNAGDFTRGSQLITHEFMMWFASAKMPLLVWFFTFLVALSIVLALLLHEHEVQMILMRIYAAGWSFMEFNPRKILNLTLPSGEVIPAPVSMIASHPDVVIAWNKLMRAIWGSLFISLFVAVPIAVWFIDFSKRRGKSILEERHQRGAMLVDGAQLADVINAHNRDMLGLEVVQQLPGKTLQDVLAMPLIERKAAGIHHAYSMAGVPFPWRTEQAHTIMIGSTGTGKTTQMRALIAQMRVRRDRAVVFDLTGAYVEAFYNPQTDTILNPMDERCPSWSVFAEAKNHADFTGIAAALLPADGGGAEPFWMLAARTLFVETCIKLIKLGEATNQALASRLMMADLKEVHKLLEHTVADPLTAPEAAKMAESIRAVFNTNAQALRFLPEGKEPFSISDWIRAEDKPGAILFITSSHNELVLNRALLSLWMNLAVHTLMRLPRTRDLRTWFFFDEVHALHRLPAIEDGLQTARGFGGAFVLGIHSFAKLAETYGKEGAQNLASLARTKLILAAADRDTAEHCSDYIGHREVRMMDEAYSYGYSNIRDAATITPRSEVQPLVLPDDIMKLPSLRGFLVFPEGFDAARIKLTYKDYPKVAEGYVLRQHVEPIEFRREPQADDGDEAGGRETKDELELPRDTEPDEALRHARAVTPSQEELNFPASPPIGPSDLPVSSLGRSMIVSQQIAGGPSQPHARDLEAGPKPVQQPAKTAPQRQSQAARELGEAAEERGRDGRTREGAKEAELDSPSLDDGPEM
ncbi:type IV secretion system DNA-binding domain-containing protein [Novosphingobium sp. ERN07]|uniref:type IV secretion system DNA-binding domain-containing protein n=1 Tax=Novosphingobium sp. ERN07 TaxID=2726187 RepID=UPI0014575B70|nr:type IV secretion system DNA-binding domain-containing protein [Novosphingobium sp. ERN07]